MHYKLNQFIKNVGISPLTSSCSSSMKGCLHNLRSFNPWLLLSRRCSCGQILTGAYIQHKTSRHNRCHDGVHEVWASEPPGSIGVLGVSARPFTPDTSPGADPTFEPVCGWYPIDAGFLQADGLNRPRFQYLERQATRLLVFAQFLVRERSWNSGETLYVEPGDVVQRCVIRGVAGFWHHLKTFLKAHLWLPHSYAYWEGQASEHHPRLH